MSEEKDVPKFLENYEAVPRREEIRPVEAEEFEAERFDDEPLESEQPAERTRRRFPWFVILLFFACGALSVLLFRGLSQARSVQPTEDPLEIAAAQTGTALALVPTPTGTLKPSETVEVEAAEVLFVFIPISRLDAARMVLEAHDAPDLLSSPTGYFADEELTQEDKSVLDQLRREGLIPEILLRNPRNEHQFDPDESLFRGEAAVWKMLLVYGAGYEPDGSECLEIFEDVSCDDPFRPWIEALWLEGYYLIGERPDLFDPNGEVDVVQFQELLGIER